MNSITHIHDLMCCDGVFDDDDDWMMMMRLMLYCNIVSKELDILI